MAINREQQLLLWCLGNDGRIPPLPDDDVDWNAFLDLAQIHNIVPIVASRLRDVPQGDIPAKVSSTLQAWRLESTRHNMALLRELSNVLDILKSEDIVAAPFKGPITAMMAYGDLSLRTCGDLDILVTRSDCPKAISILQAQAYIETTRYEAAMQATLVHEESGINIDMHWGIPPRELDLNVGLLRKSLEDFNLGDKIVHTFPVGDMFLIHCINATKEYWRPTLQQFYDIKMFIEHTDLEWRTVFKRAREIGCERVVRAALLAAHNLLTLPLPEPILMDLKKSSYAGRVAQELENHLFNGNDAAMSRQKKPPSIFPDQRAYFAELSGSPLQRAWRWTKRLFTLTSSDREWVHLPRPMSFLYYLIRPIRLLLTALRR